MVVNNCNKVFSSLVVDFLFLFWNKLGPLHSKLQESFQGAQQVYSCRMSSVSCLGDINVIINGTILLVETADASFRNVHADSLPRG